MVVSWLRPYVVVLGLVLPTLLQARYSLNQTVVEQRAQSLMTSFWHWHLEEFPEFATEVGVKGYDDKVTEYTEHAFERRVKRAATYLADIHELGNYGELGHMTRTSLVVMHDMLNTFVDGFRFRFQTAYLPCQLGYNPASTWQFVLARTKLTSHADYDNLLRRLQLIPTQILQLVTLTEIAMKRGYLRNTQGLESALKLMHTNHIGITEDSIFYKPFVHMPPDISASSRALMRRRALNIIGNSILPTLWKYWHVMTKKYLPATTEVPIGVYALPAGRALYRRYLRYHLSAPHTPEQVHQTGLSQVAAVAERVKQVAMLVDNTTLSLNTGSVIRQLLSSPRLYFNGSDDMVAGYKIAAETVHGQLHSVLQRVPDVPYRIQGTLSGPAGSYTEPSITSSGAGVFNANVNKPHGPSTNVIPLLLHELEPGHHTMFSYIQTNSPLLPLFRRRMDYTNLFSVPFHFPVYSAYDEGWALYAEHLGDEMGLYDDPLTRLGRLSNEMVRACRLVVDTGIHAYGWKRVKAEAYLTEHTGLSADQVEHEVTRYIGRPAQACAYKVGELKILEIRRQAESILGSHFDVRSFHDRLLSVGPCPLRLLEEELYSWVTEVKAKVYPEQASMSPITSGGHGDRSSVGVIWVSVLFTTELYILQMAGANHHTHRIQFRAY